MKITKEKLIELITEELEKGQDSEENIEIKSEFQKKLKDISVMIPRMKLDTKEVQLLNNIFGILLEFSNDKNSAARLEFLKSKLSQILGIKK